MPIEAFPITHKGALAKLAILVEITFPGGIVLLETLFVGSPVPTKLRAILLDNTILGIILLAVLSPTKPV